MLTAFGRRALWLGILLAVVLLPSQSGCVSRRMTIRSNPPGALVYVDDYEIGATPVSTNFTYYGTRKIRLVKDGYETLTVMQSIPTPWYQYVPIDLIAENFVPGEIRDSRVLDYQLKPQMVVPTDQLLSRAESLRGSNIIAPAGATMSRPGGLGPNPQTGAPNVMPGANPYLPPNAAPIPSMTPQQGGIPQQNINPSLNQYQQPNTSIPPGTYMPPNTSLPPGASAQPNTSIPPGAYTQPNTSQPPSLLTPPDIGGQGVHQLPPR